ncbi:hypothetical protein [Methylobacterium sp. A54F]
MTRTTITTAGFSAALLLMAALPVAAAPAADHGPTRVAEASDPVKPAAAVENEEDNTNCSRARRRLWVEGEGWIVRRITTCR